MSEKERSLQWYKDSIKNGLKFREKQAHSQLWPQYKAYYRHEFPSGIIPVNLVFSILRATVPQVYFRNPGVVVTPTRPGLEYELHARLIEDLDNWLLRELFVKYQLKRLITDSFLCGTASGFIGYDSEFGFSKHATFTKGASISQYDKSGNRIEYKEGINPGMPWFLRARPEDVVYPWGCEDKYSAEWVAYRVFRPLGDVRADSKYKGAADLRGSHVQRRTSGEGTVMSSEHEQRDMKDHEWVELWTIHDSKTKEVLALTMDHDKFLRKEEDLLQIEGLPVETLAFNPDPDYIYGIPDTRIIEPQLLELNEIRTQAMKHRRVDLLKLLYLKDAIKPEELKKLLSEDVQAAVAVEGDMADIRNSVMGLSPGASGILADLERAGEVVRGDVREMVGFSRSSTGEYQGKTHITKAEVDVVQWANQIRIDERQDMVADLVTNVVRRFNQLIFTYWDQPMVRSVIGPDGAKWWLQFKPSEIRDEYSIKVDPINVLPVDQRTKRQDAIQMAQAWSQMNAGRIKMGHPVPAELQRFFFSQFDGVDVDRMLADGAQGPMPGPGMNPEQPVPPQVAAGMMQQGGG